MKLRRISCILMTSVLAISAMAQGDHSQPPGIGGLTATVPSDDSAVNPNSKLQPRDTLNAYEEQMALVTVQTHAELAQIAEAVRAGRITSHEAAYLTRRCFELSIIRLQFLDTLHQIVETTLSKEGPPAKPEEQTPEMQTSGETLIVVPPVSSPDIPFSVAKDLELTPVQIAMIRALVSEEQRQMQPLLQQLSQNRRALAIATRTKQSGNSHIQKLAVEQSHILRRLIIANSGLQRDVYEILTDAQRARLDDKGQDTADVTKRLFAQR
jgi:LTXXQ motif family protein